MRPPSKAKRRQVWTRDKSASISASPPRCANRRAIWLTEVASPRRRRRASQALLASPRRFMAAARRALDGSDLFSGSRSRFTCAHFASLRKLSSQAASLSHCLLAGSCPFFSRVSSSIPFWIIRSFIRARKSGAPRHHPRLILPRVPWTRASFLAASTRVA